MTPALASQKGVDYPSQLKGRLTPYLHQAAQAASLLKVKVRVVRSHGDPGHSRCRTWSASLRTGGEAYALVGMDGVGSTVRGSAAKFAREPCKETLTVDLSALQEPEAPTIAVGAPTWPLQPRPVARLNTDTPDYVGAVREVLVGNGLARPEVRLAQLLCSDLDGDGTDEVLIAASQYASDPPPPDSRPGDYALVMICQIVNGQVTTLMLHEQYHTTAGEFSSPDAYAFVAVANLNGDGVMEVVVRGRYYEGEWTDVFQVKEGRLETVLTCGCGL